MPNQPPKGARKGPEGPEPSRDPIPARLSKTDWRTVKKVATGPLLGPIPGKPPARLSKPPSTKSAPLGRFSVVREKLEAILEPETRG